MHESPLLDEAVCRLSDRSPVAVGVRTQSVSHQKRAIAAHDILRTGVQAPGEPDRNLPHEIASVACWLKVSRIDAHERLRGNDAVARRQSGFQRGRRDRLSVQTLSIGPLAVGKPSEHQAAPHRGPY